MLIRSRWPTRSRTSGSRWRDLLCTRGDWLRLTPSTLRSECSSQMCSTRRRRSRRGGCRSRRTEWRTRRKCCTGAWWRWRSRWGPRWWRSNLDTSTFPKVFALLLWRCGRCWWTWIVWGSCSPSRSSSKLSTSPPDITTTFMHPIFSPKASQ